jgi:dihydroorotate dehydrogenase electron transfer subunit
MMCGNGGRTKARVVSCADVGAGHALVKIEAAPPLGDVAPGTFAMVSVPGREDLILPRPFAVLDVEGRVVSLLIKVVGEGTRWLASSRVGDAVSILAPLGRPWRPVEHGTAFLVAGGTGYAALHMLAKQLRASGVDVRLIWGQANVSSFPDRTALAIDGIEVRDASVDGSCGFSGTSVACLADLLDEKPADGAACVFGAGPVPMLRGLVDLARERSLPCQVSLEARMACGIGVCRGCVVNARDAHPATGLRRRVVCKDGPVFDADELDWEHLQ